MFTGLVEIKGSLTSFEDYGQGRRLSIEAAPFAGEVSLGESIAVNGCCLTVAEIHEQTLRFDLLGETLARTNLGSLAVGSQVNLERALLATARLGGHFVQGHIDCTTTVLDARESSGDLLLDFALPAASAHYVVAKGSIALNGVSLTVATLNAGTFGVCIIPHTREHTNLGALKPGDAVNVEFDILAKYIERMVGRTVTP